MPSSLHRFAAKIREINQRYSKPHIEMSLGVKISLMALRIYLLLLVSLILYKFVLMLN
ncbi:MAG: hypothetical protein K2P57_04930 [Burkholderiales bacterium]|nr:hypothetical protein [Burkholderiales bacterium]